MKQELMTIGQISELLEEPPARIAYIIAKHRIKPISRVGIIRLFAGEQVKAIKQGLYGIQIRKTK